MRRRTIRVAGIVVALAAVVVPGGAGVASAAGSPPAWKVVATPDVPADTYLRSVSCPDVSSCVAVGSVEHIPNRPKAIVERWNGSDWSLVSPPRSSGSRFLGVSCASATFCVAVGDTANPKTTPGTLIEMWDGVHWSVVPSPNPSQFGNRLTAVSCASATHCVAVGFLSDMHGYKFPISAIWDGKTWTFAGPPYQGFVDDNTLAGVACANETRCEAVGVTVGAPEGDLAWQLLVSRWNGRKWVLEPVGDSRAVAQVLASVSCATLRRCVAVGSTAHRTLFATLGGTGWSLQPGPDTGAARAFLSGVACPEATRCAAVGAAGPNSRQTGALVEVAHGSSWSVVSGVPQAGSTDALASVSCATPSRCVAVGSTRTAGVAAPLVLTGGI